LGEIPTNEDIEKAKLEVLVDIRDMLNNINVYLESMNLKMSC
jgi:hypothetical protein